MAYLDRSEFNETRKELVQPTVRIVIALALLYGLLFVLTRIPGTDRVIISPDITVATILFSTIIVVMFGAVLNYATTVGTILADIFDGFPEIERIVQLVVLFAIIIVSYRVFWWIPYFRENPGQYDLMFLILGLGVGGWLSFILYTNVDKISALFTDQVVRTDSPEFRSESDRETSMTHTPSTAHESPNSADAHASSTDREQSAPQSSSQKSSMPSSGESEMLEGNEQTPSNNCPECDTSLPDNAQFCHECGAKILD